MRKHAFRLFFTVSLSILLAVTSTGANSGINLRATIPFDFILRDETLPAGTYTFAATSTNDLFIIRGQDSSRGIFFMTSAAFTKSNPGSAKLIFRKYDNQYFLAGMSAYDANYEVNKSSKERQLIRELRNHLARGAGAPELVTISAN